MPALARAGAGQAVIGYTDLAARPGVLKADGAGVAVAQVEAFPTGTTNYSPDTTDPVLAGKTFTLRGGATGISPHALQVASLFYGNVNSPAPDVSTVALFSANSFLDGLLRVGKSGKAPGGAGAMVISNSWVAAYNSDANNIEALHRLDDLINRDDVLVFNGVSNTAADPFPKLMASSFNGVTVGSLEGSHGPFTYDAKGQRIKPDVVVDTAFVSNSNALAAGAGTLLRSEAKVRRLKAGELAIKAILMAGAQRDENWRRGRPTGKDNATAPLDFQQGAGQLRVDQSFDVLMAGKQPAGTAIDSDAGWDNARTARGNPTATYTMHVDQTLPKWAAVLTWNRTIRGLNDGKYSTKATMPDFDLSLYLTQPGGAKRSLISHSDSPYDNVETLTLTDLAPGDYQLELTTDIRSYYALAWYAQPDVGAAAAMPALAPIFSSAETPASASGLSVSMVPEPGAMLLAVAMAALSLRRGTRRIHRNVNNNPT